MQTLREQLIALLFVVLSILIIPLVMIALGNARKRGEPIRISIT